MTPANDNRPRLLTKKQAAAYLGASPATFAKWVLAGIIPSALSITRKWDKKALDAALDKISCLESNPRDDGYELRKREGGAKKISRAS